MFLECLFWIIDMSYLDSYIAHNHEISKTLITAKIVIQQCLSTQTIPGKRLIRPFLMDFTRYQALVDLVSAPDDVGMVMKINVEL